jgi:hypothetical protein
LIAGELMTDVAAGSAAPPVIVRAGRDGDGGNRLVGSNPIRTNGIYVQRAAGKVVRAALPRSPMTRSPSGLLVFRPEPIAPPTVAGSTAMGVSPAHPSPADSRFIRTKPREEPTWPSK